MELVVVVQILQTHEKFTYDDAYIILGYETRFQKVSAATARAILHDDPKIRSLEVRAIVFGNVRRVETRKNGNLLNNIIDLILGILNIDDLDGDGLTSTFINARMQFGQRTLKQRRAREYNNDIVGGNLPFVDLPKTSSAWMFSVSVETLQGSMLP